jgi:hypothetical protein
MCYAFLLFLVLLVAGLDHISRDLDYFCLLTSHSQILYLGPKHAIHFLTSQEF